MDKPKTIGQTKALMPEAGTANRKRFLKDGGNGDTSFPFDAAFKVLATVGEVDTRTGQALTGYPDGNAAWLLDDNTVRLAYQSESYATIVNETYGSEMESGVKFTGSKIHYIDYDRQKFADFLNNDNRAAGMVKGSGELYHRIFNVFGQEVTPKNSDPTDLSAKWGNQVTPDGELIEFATDQMLTQGDFHLHSLCGNWYEPANKYGHNIGFKDDVWLAGEEWNIGEAMFADPDGAGPLTGVDEANRTMGLASVVVDLDSKILYTAPALGQTGYEKIMPINPGHKDYVVMVMAGYNHDQEPVPNRIYVGRKGYDANGNEIDVANASGRDIFLAQNGLLYGQIYGLALREETYERLGIDLDSNGDGLLNEYAVDSYLTNTSAPNKFGGKFYPTSYRWDGFDSPEAVEDTEMMLWEKAEEQPAGYAFFNGDAKMEHPAADPSGRPRFFQNMTDEGALLGFDLGNLKKQLNRNDDDGNGLPDHLNVKVRRTVAAVDGALTLETDGKGLVHTGPANLDGTATAAKHVETGLAKMVSPDGLFWAQGSDGSALIVDEDSGNDYGERKYILPIDTEMGLRDEATGYFIAQAGGLFNPRATAGVAAMAGTFSRATGSEFSGSWDVTGMVAKKEDGTLYSKRELDGPGMQEVASQIPLAQHTFIGVVQQPGESGGQVAEQLADQGGQIFMFNFNVL